MIILFTLLIAVLAAINCSLLGTYLMLRRMAMMGDAISHAVLPGIVVAFFLTGSKAPLTMLLGAGAVGMLTTLLIAFLNQKVRLQADASIGVNFTWLFALGIVLISCFDKKIDLDPECVLYGEVAYAPIDTWLTIGGVALGPQSMYTLLAILLCNMAFILLCYKELLVTTFDPSFASSLGMHNNRWHYLIMGFTSLTMVATVEIVGVVLVIALLIVPPATVYLFGYQLPKLLGFSVLLSVCIALLGYLVAVWLDGTISGAMATVAGVLFAVALCVHKCCKKQGIASEVIP